MILRVLLLFFCWNYAANAALQTRYTSYAEDHWDFDFDSNWIQTESNFSDEGLEAENLGDSRFYNAFQNSIRSRFVVGPAWAVYGKLALSYVETQSDTTFFSHSGAMPMIVGVDFRLWQSKRLQLIPDLSLSVPFNSINYDNPESNNPILSDEAFGIHSRMRLLMPFKASYLAGYLGVNWRGQGFSTLLSYNIGYERLMTRWVFGAELEGATTIGVDENQAAYRHIVNESVAGGSLLYNAVDPSHMNLGLWGGYRFGPYTTLRFGLGQTLTGVNTAQATSLFLGFRYGAKSVGQVQDPRRKLKRYKKRIKRDRKTQRERQDSFRTLKEPTYERAFEEDPKDRRKRLDRISDELKQIEKKYPDE